MAVNRDEGGAAPRAAADAWLSPGRFALLLGGLVFVAFPQVVLGWETFVLRDFGVFSYPLAYFQRECFWQGELPLWNPYNDCGVPFLAQWNTMPLYPPALIYLLAPLSWALGCFGLLHLWFAGLGMYWLARRWTGDPLAAALAGVVFAFNGLTLNLLMWPSHIATLSWMPWVLLAAEPAWSQGGRKIIVAAMLGAMQMLAGGPETILLTWLLVGGLWLTLGKGNRIRTAARLGTVVLLVAGLAAVQLLPFLDLAAHSQREQGYADTRWSLPGRGWANFLVPMVFGSTWGQDVFYQYDQYWTSSYYVGAGTVLLAMLAVGLAREGRVRLLLCAAAAAFVLALGDQTPVYGWLRRVLPQLTLMTYPVKFVTVVVFATPLLAGYALAALRQKRIGAKPVVLFGALLLVLVAGILSWEKLTPGPHDDFGSALRNGLSRAVFVAAAVALLLLIRRERRSQGVAAWAALLLLASWLDVWTHEPNQNPTVSPRVYTPGMVRAEQEMKPEPTLGESRVMLSPAARQVFDQVRVKDLARGFVRRRFGYFSDGNLLDETPKVDGFFSLYPREQAALGGLLYSATNASFQRLEDFMAVSQITSAADYTRFEPRAAFLPEVTAGQKPVFLDDTNALAGILQPDFDGGKEVLLPLEAAPLVLSANPANARVLSHRFGLRQVDAEVDAEAPTLVVISQTYYHRWRAYVDGQPAPLLRANYAFQAVPVPAGRHQVRVVYEDRTLQVGAIVSLLTLIGCVAMWRRKGARSSTRGGASSARF